MGADRPLEAPLWNVANALTMFRLVLVPVFIWLYLQPGTGLRLAATGVFLLAALTDRLDGHLARSRGLITNFGKLMDPIADKALVLSAMILLSLDGAMPWWVTALILVREIGITALRFVMVRRAVMAASKGGKLKTVLQIVFLIGLLFPWHAVLPASPAGFMHTLAVVIMYVALAQTLYSGGQYVVDAARLARTAPRAG